MLYVTLKALHVGAAIVSVSLFALRFGLTLADRRWRQSPLRWMPHVNDTLLLAAAIGLCLITGWTPLLHPWLTLKIALLVAYIGTGKVALNENTSPRSRALAGAAALLLVASIFLIALTRPL
jgi:uncharacterized membrane protein SirB2